MEPLPWFMASQSIAKAFNNKDAMAAANCYTEDARGSSGDLGYEVGRFQTSFKDASGKVTTERGKYIDLLKRGEDCTWKATHGIWNMDTLALK